MTREHKAGIVVSCSFVFVVGVVVAVKLHEPSAVAGDPPPPIAEKPVARGQSPEPSPAPPPEETGGETKEESGGAALPPPLPSTHPGPPETVLPPEQEDPDGGPAPVGPAPVGSASRRAPALPAGGEGVPPKPEGPSVSGMGGPPMPGGFAPLPPAGPPPESPPPGPPPPPPGGEGAVPVIPEPPMTPALPPPGDRVPPAPEVSPPMPPPPPSAREEEGGPGMGPSPSGPGGEAPDPTPPPMPEPPASPVKEPGQVVPQPLAAPVAAPHGPVIPDELDQCIFIPADPDSQPAAPAETSPGTVLFPPPESTPSPKPGGGEPGLPRLKPIEAGRPHEGGRVVPEPLRTPPPAPMPRTDATPADGSVPHVVLTGAQVPGPSLGPTFGGPGSPPPPPPAAIPPPGGSWRPVRNTPVPPRAGTSRPAPGAAPLSRGPAKLGGGPELVTPPLRAMPVHPSPPAGAPIRPRVRSWDEIRHVCKQGESYRSVSRHYFLSEDFAMALQLYNQHHPLTTEPVRRNAMLIPGEVIFIPAEKVLEERYGAVLRRKG
jgi:hypothetical protein